MATMHATPRLPELHDLRDLGDLRDARTRPAGPRVSVTGWEDPVQRVADATVWLLFRVSGVRS